MSWQSARDIAREHGLGERAIVETLYASEHWRQVEVGGGDRDLWRREAHSQLEALAGRPLPPLHDHWRARQRLIQPNIDLIRALRPPYRTAVLSNADTTLTQRLHDVGIHDLFDAVVCSADVRIAKPEPRIYPLAAEALGLPPAECIFIDDLEANVEAARAAGMQALQFLIDRGDRLDEQLRELGISAPSGTMGA
jgi:putative hydrolase of the HAD superfamily